MIGGPLVHVIVIDDVCRFALHMWRYLGAPLGIGIGRVPFDDGQANRLPDPDENPQSTCTEGENHQPIFTEDGKPRPIFTEDGNLALWWLPAVGETWKGMLKKIFEEYPTALKWFLVDMKGRESKPEKTGDIPSITTLTRF